MIETLKFAGWCVLASLGPCFIGLGTHEVVGGYIDRDGWQVAQGALAWAWGAFAVWAGVKGATQ